MEDSALTALSPLDGRYAAIWREQRLREEIEEY